MESLAQHIAPVVLGGVSDMAAQARVSANQGKTLTSAQADEVISQFEQMFVRMMLKSMRTATDTLNPEGLGGKSLFGGGNNTSYLEMFDGQIAARLSEGRGLGLGRMLREQLGLGGADVPPSDSADGKLAALPPRRDFGNVPMPFAAESTYRYQQAADRAARAATPSPAAAGVGRTASTEPVQLFEDAGDFVASLLPLARRTAQRLGVGVRGLLAQMALETGWGRHVPPGRTGGSSHNLFGIKTGSGWGGERATVSTLEVEDGVFHRRQASFRVYDTISQGLEDYVALLRGTERYAQALDVGDNTAAFARGLQEGGYATDPDYARKIESIASGKLQRLLDQLGEQP